MSPEDTLTPSQEATQLARELVKAERAWRSEKGLRKLVASDRDELRDEVERRGEANRMHQRNYEYAQRRYIEAERERDEAQGQAYKEGLARQLAAGRTKAEAERDAALEELAMMEWAYLDEDEAA